MKIVLALLVTVLLTSGCANAWNCAVNKINHTNDLECKQ